MRYGELDACEPSAAKIPSYRVNEGSRLPSEVTHLRSSASFASVWPACMVCILRTWLLLCLS